MSVSAPPSETGQSAFQKIVAKLEADPLTDWSKVENEALRQHLSDMNNVTLNAVVETEEDNDAFRFLVTAEDAARGPIRRMVMGHVTSRGIGLERA